MKLCRFELKSEPGVARSGMVYAGKVYETDGANATGIHEAADIRPLAPLPVVPSLRVVSANSADPDDPSFYYLNPAAIIGPSQIVNPPGIAGTFEMRSYLAATLVEGGYRLDEAEVDGYVLGYTLVSIMVATDIEKFEQRTGASVGRSHDLGIAMGPVLTTPDEIEDAVIDRMRGPRFRLSAVSRTNGVDKATANLEDFTFSIHQAIWSASQTCTLRAGDVFALGPIFSPGSGELSPGDDYQVSVERLGTLSTKLNTYQE